MKRIFQLLCGAAVIMMTETAASDVHGYASFAYPLRALFSYPLKGHTGHARPTFGQTRTLADLIDGFLPAGLGLFERL